MGTITWIVNVQVEDGPSIPVSSKVEIDAYDRVEAEVPAKNASTPGKKDVLVQPGSAAQVNFLLIIIDDDQYDVKLTYSVPPGTEKIPIDSPQLLVGKGMIGLYGHAPKEFKFENDTDTAKNVTVFVGRTA